MFLTKGEYLLLAQARLRIEVEHDGDQGPDDVREQGGTGNLAHQGR